jgi:hypothetical protein
MKYISNTSVTELSEYISSEKQALSFRSISGTEKQTTSDVVASSKTQLLPPKKQKNVESKSEVQERTGNTWQESAKNTNFLTSG